MSRNDSQTAVFTPTLNSNKAGFTLMELMWTIGILILLLNCFYVALFSVYRMQKLFETETMSVVVMNNLLERVVAEDVRDATNISVIFRDEYEKSPISKNDRLTPECTTKEGVITVRILKENGKPLTKLEFRQ